MNKATIGKILGALGLVSVLSVPLTLLVSDDPLFVVLVKLGVGAVLIALFFILHGRQLGQFATGRSTFFMVSTVGTLAAAVAVLAGVNYIVMKKNKSWDITSKKIHSLSPQTVSTLKGLSQKITATAFAEPKDPAYEAMDQLLTRYKSEAPDKLEYTFKSPKKAPDLVAKYGLRQGQNAIVLTRGEGASESHTTVNLPNGPELEQELTNGILKLTAGGEKKAYLVIGHGEWPLEAASPESAQGGEASISELKRDLTQEGYAPEAINLAGKTEIPRDAAMVIIAGPRQPLTAPEAEVVKKYLDEGGRLILFAEAQAETGLDKALAEYGIQVDPGIVADDQFAVESPYNVISQFYGSSDITQTLRSVQLNTIFITARGLTLLKEGLASGVKAEPLVLTSPAGWVESTPDQNPQRSDGEKTGSIPIAAISTRPTAEAPNKRSDEARLVVIGDSDILVDVFWGTEGNRNLVLNSLAWATNQVQKVTIRPPDRDISTIDVDKDMLGRLRLVSSDLFPITLLGLGLAIWLARRSK
jgi:ABC-type uncharacterized transport system involved in gliding motility auxiliary subunit